MAEIAFCGNLTAPVEIRYTQSGKAVGNASVAVNRGKDEKAHTDFFRVTLWEGLAENAAQLVKGTRVIVVGDITSRDYETKAGEKRTAWEVNARAFGPDVRWARVTAEKIGRDGGSRPAGGAFGAAPVQPPRNDAAARQAANERGWGASVDDGWNSSTPIDVAPF